MIRRTTRLQETCVLRRRLLLQHSVEHVGLFFFMLFCVLVEDSDLIL